MTIDLNFRPASYADFDNPVALALNGIEGQMRRTMARDMLLAEGDQREHYDAVLGPIDDEILSELIASSPVGRKGYSAALVGLKSTSLWP